MISIHSLVKRETGGGLVMQNLEKISIHSLVKRETTSIGLPADHENDFNPLPRKEGDCKQWGVERMIQLFQSTPS